ncbi:MAG: hypothetical protein AB1781_07190 [Pseudomonadota bacterium]
MDDWICQKNIEHFRAQLRTLREESRRKVLMELLAAEEARLGRLSLRRRPDNRADDRDYSSPGAPNADASVPLPTEGSNG